MGNSAFRPRRATRPSVEIKRGVREELLVLIDGRLASLTRPETVSALKAGGSPVVRELCLALETGVTEARADAAWLLGRIGVEAAIPALTRTIEGARWRGEAPVVLRRSTEALLLLGPAGVEAFDRAVTFFAPDDLTRLLLIRHASERLMGAAPLLPLPRQTTREWGRALAAYRDRLERLNRISRADKLSFQRIVLEAHGLSIEREREVIPAIIEFLNGYPAHARDQANHAS